MFIINPHSGVGKHAFIERIIDSELDRNRFEYEIRYTSYAGHAREIAVEMVQQKLDMVVAVGGDGTINEIASGLVHSNTALGIIPAGSGNGLARHLKISVKPRKAIRNINNGHITAIDAWKANEYYFFNVSGCGFDAEVSKAFSKSKSRGFQNYAKLSLNLLNKYQPKEYSITYNGEKRQLNAFMISLANSSQFGNNAKIAPYANIQDGLLDVCIVPRLSIQEVPLAAVRLFRGNLYKSKKVEFIQVDGCVIEQADTWMHIDGDPVEIGNTIHIQSFPKALQVITPY